MKRTFKLLAPIILLSSLTLWFAFPGVTSRLLINLNNFSAGLTSKTISTELGDISYLVGGDGDTIVLLHGIYARKEHWVDLARKLTDNYRVVALDLPGFGDNKSLSIEQYQLSKQATNLATVLAALNINSAHFGANSMGAQVIAILATENPDVVQSIAFIGSPLGVPTMIKSDMDRALQASVYPLVVKSEEDFENRNQWLFPEIPSVPGPILKTWMQKEIASPLKNEQIWRVVHNFPEVSYLSTLAINLPMPTLIIWCNEDRIFHVSGAALLDGALPQSSLHILSGCGHVPMLDKPEKVAELYIGFLNQHNRK